MVDKTNNERLARVEEKLDNACVNMNELKSDVKQGFESINARFDALDHKYSPKWVEKAVTAIISLIVIGVFGALLDLVVK